MEELVENQLKQQKQPIKLNQKIPQLELCKGVYKEIYIDMFSSEPFALLVGNGNKEKTLKLPLLAKKLENNIYINANGAKGKIDEKGYLANALKRYDENLVEAFIKDFKERYKIEKLYYLLDDSIKNFEFAKIKYKISLYFKDAKFYPKSVALGLYRLFRNELQENNRLRYNGVDLVIKRLEKNKTFNRCGLVLERQKSDDSKAYLLKDEPYIKQALKNFKKALELEKQGIILYKECLPKLSMEVIKDGRFINFEIIKDKTSLEDKERLKIETPFIVPKGKKSIALPLILGEEKIAYQGKITSKDFPLKDDEKCKLTLTYDTSTEFNCLLEFRPNNANLESFFIEWERIDTNGVELPIPEPIKKPSIGELKNNFNPKRNETSDLFEWVLKQLEILKDLNSASRFFLEQEMKFLEKKLEYGEILRTGKDKNNMFYCFVKTQDKEVFCHSQRFKGNVNIEQLSQGVRVCLEVKPDKKDPSKYQGSILVEDKESVLLNEAKKHLNERITHRIKALEFIRYPCLKIFSHYTLKELETLNPSFTNSFEEHLERLEKYYFDPMIDKEFKEFKQTLLTFFSYLNDNIPTNLQQKFIELHSTHPLLGRCLGSLKENFQKKIFKNLKDTFFKSHHENNQRDCFKILEILAKASWTNREFLGNFMAQTSLEEQKYFLKCIEECLKDLEECLKDLKPFYFSSACELLLAFLSYRNLERGLELILESEKTMRLLDSIDKAIEKKIEIRSFVKLKLKTQSFKNIPPLLLALRLYLRGDLEGVGIEIKGIEENE
ncbi:hypothetical protein ACQJ5K_00265 [Helicobacter pylori]